MVVELLYGVSTIHGYALCKMFGVNPAQTAHGGRWCSARHADGRAIRTAVRQRRLWHWITRRLTYALWVVGRGDVDVGAVCRHGVGADGEATGTLDHGWIACGIGGCLLEWRRLLWSVWRCVGWGCRLTGFRGSRLRAMPTALVAVWAVWRWLLFVLSLLVLAQRVSRGSSGSTHCHHALFCAAFAIVRVVLHPLA